MTEIRDRYFATLGFNPSGPSAKSKLEKALDRAYRLRTFEIERYWNRATYFWGYQVAIFAALGFLWASASAAPAARVNPNELGLVKFALSGLGVLTALANSLSARGSKFWQENWEKHIDMLEDYIEGRLHKTVWLQKGKKSYSVSRIHKGLSDVFVVFWVLILLYEAWTFLGSPSFGWPSALTSQDVLTGILLLLTFIGGAYLWCQKSRLHATLPQPDGAHGDSIKWRSLWCTSIDAKKPPPFIRRRAPDEDP